MVYSFFEKCKKQIGKSKRYLTRDQDGGRYDGTWKLIVPNDLQNMKNGVMMDADIYNKVETLFDDREVAERIKNHPMAIWKCQQ